MPALWLAQTDTIDPTGPNGAWAIQQATDILFKLTGEKYSGVMTSTDVFTAETFTDVTLRPTVISGNISNIPQFQPGIRNLRLRQTPVRSIQSITWNGSTMDPSEYTLRNNAYVVRSYGIPWIFDPVNAIEITYTHGDVVPIAGKRAAIRLANELIWAETDPNQSSLPTRISTISRQGETFTVMDPLNFLNDGKTGIYEIDLFLMATNPDKARKKSKVFSPDKPRGERIN